MKNCLLLGLVYMFFSLPAVADENKWAYIGSGSVGKVYLQGSGIDADINSGDVKAWTKTILPEGGHTLDKYKYACSKGEYLKLESYRYDINNKYQFGGKFKPNWLSAIPESVGALTMKAVCTTAAKQEIDKIQLIDGGYTSNDTFALIRSSFAGYADAVVMTNIQESIDNIEW